MISKAKYFKYLLLGIIELILIFIIIFLGFNIFSPNTNRIKGIQVTNLSNNINFSEDQELKYFYEPKSDHVELWNPNWLGYEIKNKINSDSLHESTDYPIEKPDTIYRIITLGDSWVFGMYVKDDENYPQQLDKALNEKLACKKIDKFEVLNLGVGGYDIEYAIHRYIKRGVKYKPDLIIWLANDWNFKNINEITIPMMQKLRAEGLQDFDAKNKKYIISELTRKALIEKYGRKGLADYQTNVINRLSPYIQSKLLIVSLSDLSSDFIKVIYNFVQRNSNYYYYGSIAPLYNHPEYILTDSHPNKKGYEIITEDLFNYIAKNILSECERKTIKEVF